METPPGVLLQAEAELPPSPSPENSSQALDVGLGVGVGVGVGVGKGVPQAVHALNLSASPFTLASVTLTCTYSLLKDRKIISSCKYAPKLP